MRLLLLRVGMEVLISPTFLPFFFLNITTFEPKHKSFYFITTASTLVYADSLLLQFGD